MIKGHGGNIFEIARMLGCHSSDIVDMSSNLNPLGPPDNLINHLNKNLNNTISILPEVDAFGIIKAFADKYNINPEMVLAGSGTTQFIYILPLALKIKKALILGPTYSDYADACKMHNVYYSYFLAEESNNFLIDIEQLKNQINQFDTVFICNPNNPTGALISAFDIKRLCSAYPNIFFIIDESYLPFVWDGEKESMLNSGLSNVIVLNSMSKVFTIPGIRIGFITGCKDIIKKISNYLLPWSVNGIAQHAANYLLSESQEIEKFIEDTRIYIEKERNYFISLFQYNSSIKIFKSNTSFLLAKLHHSFTSDFVCNEMLKRKILIRNCSNFLGLSNWIIRISLKSRELNIRLSEILLKIL